MGEDLDAQARGDELLDDHGRAHRIGLPEELGIDPVHAGSVGSFGEKHLHLHDICEGPAGGLDRDFEVLKRAACLRLDVAKDRLAGDRVLRDVNGPEKTAGVNRFADRNIRRIGAGIDDFKTCSSSLVSVVG